MKNVAIPTAKAGEKLAKPALVQTTFIKASVRNVKEEEGRQVVVLTFEGLPSNIVRNPSQVKGDLSNFYPKETLELISKSATACVDAYVACYSNKDIAFEGSYHEVGAIQTIDEKSKLYINGVVNPETNQPFAIGDTTPTTNSGIWVEGFIEAVKTVDEAKESLQAYLEAASKAKANELALEL